MLNKKKKIIFYSIFILLICLFIFLNIIILNKIRIIKLSLKFTESVLNYDFSSPFSINKIVCFSSANCETDINQNSSFTIKNLYQYTDMAIFINNNSNGNFDSKNTLNSVTLSNIEFVNKPNLGTPNLYYKSLNEFATSSYNENNLIENGLEFQVSSDDEIDFNNPMLYNNCANPITLCYINSNVKSNYTLVDSISNISYDRKFA